jgi:MFS family permease
MMSEGSVRRSRGGRKTLESRFRSLISLWNIRDFRRLCGSQVLAGLGEWLATMALIALVWERTHSALISGLVLVLRILPAAVLGSMLGSFVDRFDGKRVLVWCTAARAAVYGALPFVSGIGVVLALALLAEITSIAYTSARDATLPRLVPMENLPTANAVSMGSVYGAMPAGSALFALFTIFGSESIEMALATAGALTAVATLIVGRINAKACAAQRDASCADEPITWRAGLRQLREVMRGDPILRRVAIGGTAAATGGGVVITLGQAYVRGTLHAGPASFSMLLLAFCMGIVAGVVAIHRARAHLPKIFLAGIAAMGAILVLMALVPRTGVGIAMGFVFGAAFVVVFLGGVTILQERIHDSLRGRAFAVAHSGLRVAAVLMGVLAAWGARALGSEARSLGVLALDGTQVMFAFAGLLLSAVAVTMLKSGVLPARAAEH